MASPSAASFSRGDHSREDPSSPARGGSGRGAPGRAGVPQGPMAGGAAPLGCRGRPHSRESWCGMPLGLLRLRGVHGAIDAGHRGWGPAVAYSQCTAGCSLLHKSCRPEPARRHRPRPAPSRGLAARESGPGVRRGRWEGAGAAGAPTAATASESRWKSKDRGIRVGFWGGRKNQSSSNFHLVC